MLYFVLAVIAIWIGFFVWTGIQDKKKKARSKKEDKPLFRTEDNLEEYGKPLDKHPVDFDDAE